MNDSRMREYTHISGDINSLYHEVAVKIGLSDSAMNILYVVCENGSRCLQAELCKFTGMSRQTVNSAIRKLEKDGIVYLEQGQGRNTIVCLTEMGQKFSEEKIFPIFEMEREIWNEWTDEEQQQYLAFQQTYRDTLKKYVDMIFK